ncbi:MAG: PHP domain-containing protein [Gammaproteobacteria bacterium]|nr:PHP domain-containing protein [Gammaproteobacteria bacterium]
MFRGIQQNPASIEKFHQAVPINSRVNEIYDLHCHSLASDGVLSPYELVKRASAQGVTTLALTDHDTTAGIAEAQWTAETSNIRLISGIELSTTWQGKTFHVVGLNIDHNHPTLLAAAEFLRKIRQERAEQIADKLAKKRIPGALEWVLKSAGEGMVTRTHFASFLVSQFHADSQQDAFDRYLAKGKPAYVATEWADMALSVQWINEAGGVAVLAHPLRYKLTPKWMQRFLTDFKQAGGKGMEVVTGRCSVDDIKWSATYAHNFGLAGSVGTDFHSPGNPWIELGRLAPLPGHIQPVWELFG